MKKITKSYLDELTYQVNGAAIEVHKAFGPGLLESVYHNCLKQELTLRNISFQSEMVVPVIYKGLKIDARLRCDLFIENCLVAELKAIESVLPIHEAQVLTYMKLLEIPKGVIYNFNVLNLFKQGQKTYVNEYFRNLPY
jgi:GxxExxY protein